MKLSRNALAHILLVATVAVWGTTFVVVQNALHDASPAVFNFLRMALSAVVLAAMFPREISRITRKQLAGGAVVGACLAAGYAFQTAGLLYTTPSRSAFITGMVVVLVPLLSIVPMLRAPGQHRPRPAAFAGAAVAFCGLALLTTPKGASLTGMNHLGGGINHGDLLTAGCSLSFALHLLAIARVSRYTDARRLAMLQTAFAAVLLGVMVPFTGPRISVTPRLLVALAVTAVFATAFAFLVQSWAQTVLPATHAALIFTLEPVFAAVTSYVFVGERLGGRALLGAGLILAGIAVTEFLSGAPVPAD